MLRFLRRKARLLFILLLGSKPKAHTIPFGPLRGKKIFMSFELCPGAYFGYHERWISKLSNEILINGDIVYDVGAHLGYTSLLFVEKISNSGFVHAFELVPSTIDKYLNKSLILNKTKNVIVHNVGLGSSNIKLEAFVDKRAMGSTKFNPSIRNRSFEMCEVVRLDDYIIEMNIQPPSLIKVDIQGGETDFLYGGINTIRQYKPNLIIEFHTLKLLEEGYKILNPIGYKMETQYKGIVNELFFKNQNTFGESVFCSHENKKNTIQPRDKL